MGTRTRLDGYEWYQLCPRIYWTGSHLAAGNEDILGIASFCASHCYNFSIGYVYGWWSLYYCCLLMNMNSAGSSKMVQSIGLFILQLTKYCNELCETAVKVCVWEILWSTACHEPVNRSTISIEDAAFFSLFVPVAYTYLSASQFCYKFCKVS